MTDDHHAVRGGDREDRVAGDARLVGLRDAAALRRAVLSCGDHPLREQQRVGPQRDEVEHDGQHLRRRS